MGGLARSMTPSHFSDLTMVYAGHAGRLPSRALWTGRTGKHMALHLKDHFSD